MFVRITDQTDDTDNTELLLCWLWIFGIKLGGIFEIIFRKKYGTAVSAVAYLSYTVGCFFVCRLGKGLRVLGIKNWKGSNRR